MSNLGRCLGRALGLGLAWGVAWFGAGVLVARVPGFFSDLPFALLFTPFGVIASIVGSVVLGVLEGRGGLDRASLPRVAAWGAASGLLSAVIVTALRGEVSEIGLFAPVLALAGAICAAGSAAVVRRSATENAP